LAHADPASELPACMVALSATIIARGQAGERRIAAKDFFTGIYETALSPQELLIAVEVPVPRRDSTHFFEEFARRHGDYAIVGAAAQAVVHRGVFADLGVAFFAVSDRPVLAKATARLVDVPITPATLSDVAMALGEELDPQQDQQASAAMRRHLAKVLLVRCVSALLGRPDLSGASA
ncbi:MAG: FAD binding domain-containing protein, partial [Bradyrhizobium sp.]